MSTRWTTPATSSRDAQNYVQQLIEHPNGDFEEEKVADPTGPHRRRRDEVFDAARCDVTTPLRLTPTEGGLRHMLEPKS